jgi:hypothetical protein
VRGLAAPGQRPLAGAAAARQCGLRGVGRYLLRVAWVALGRGRPSASFQLANPLTAAQTGAPGWGSIRGHFYNIKNMSIKSDTYGGEGGF